MSESSRPNIASIDWRWRHFDELRAIELDAIYRARQQVFVVEQHCAFVDADGFDSCSWHLAAWASTSTPMLPLAYARVVPPGEKFAEPSIGRVLTLQSARGMGLGCELTERTIAHCEAIYPGAGIRISAQSRLEAFYARFGFIVVSDRYFEDDIEHTEMLRPCK